MKFKILLQASIVTALLFSSGCQKNFLDKTPEGDLSLDEVFSKTNYTESFLTSVYASLPQEIDLPDDPGKNPFIGASDEMEITYGAAFSNIINDGGWNPTNINRVNIWLDSYRGIRKANIFIENIDKLTAASDAVKSRWKGEAIFLRAFFYFQLIRAYGPVPLIDHALKTDDDFNGFKRAPLKDLVNFIVKGCDDAGNLLPIRITNTAEIGRANKAVALALKARVLLYAASPLWNGNSDYSSFTDKDGLKLFPDQDLNRWATAAAAAKDCIDQSEAAGYKLYRSANNDPIASCQNLFIANNNDEVFFARNEGYYQHLDRCSEPRSLGGYTILCPTQEIVDDFEMANGLAPITGYNADGSPIIDPASGYQETGYTAVADPKGNYVAGTRNMYVGREARFYANINFTGARWKTRSPLQFFKTGADGRVGSDYCKTGYLNKKGADPASNIVNNQFGLKTWIYFRLGEQYLNYAEALNESQGAVNDVYKYVNLIRDRAGLPSLPAGLSKDQMRDRIRHERRIELAFETHRYFDARRWKIAIGTESKPIHGMDITQGTSLQDDAYYKRTVVENRIFINKHYLWPIPQDEIDKYPQLVQNPGW